MASFNFLPPLALYIHFPWCERKCPYCDFNSHAVRDGIPEQRYIDALLADLESDLPRVWGRPVRSVFLGGGTPSLFSPAAIDRLLAGVRARVTLLPEAEVTLEANPGSVETGRFQGYGAAGINRLSIGVQSFQPELLQRLGRIHGREEALQAATAARAAGIDNFNLDLMFGLPGQTHDAALADLETALHLQPAHLSLYQLTLEPNTLFHSRPPVLPDEDVLAGMQSALQARLAAAGFEQYEVSAYARHGQRCRHNLNYWQFGDYLGIGAGAHAKLTTADAVTRLWKVKQPDRYLQAAGTEAVLGGVQTVGADDVVFEFMLNALRLNAGVSTRLFTERTGLDVSVLQKPLDRARARRLLEPGPERLQATPLGRQYLNELVGMFLPETSH